MRKRFRFRFVTFSIIILFLAGTFGWWWQSNVRDGKYKDLLSAFYVMSIVKLSYYQPVNLVQLMDVYWKKGNISAMLKSLKDPYTRFLSKNEYEELRKDTQGTFGGIGVFLITKEDELLISKVVSGSPSEKAGLQEGDRIIEVGETIVKNVSTEVAIAKIRGLAGTSIRLKVIRGEAKQRRELVFNIKRKNIMVPTVELAFQVDPVLGKYAIIKITQFSETTPRDLEKSLSKIDQNPDCKALALDLRANPGGSLDAAIKVVSQFVPEHTPVLHIKRRGALLQTISSEYYVHKQLPMVILVDSWSASAAEIVSGALKDQNRAILVGTRTYGKDLIQEIKELPGGTAMTITIASYLTSGKVNIHKKGVQPDKVVEIPGALDRLLKNGDSEAFKKMYQLQEEEALRILRSQSNKEQNRLAS